jgi:hypothetical protein
VALQRINQKALLIGASGMGHVPEERTLFLQNNSAKAVLVGSNDTTCAPVAARQLARRAVWDSGFLAAWQGAANRGKAL